MLKTSFLLVCVAMLACSHAGEQGHPSGHPGAHRSEHHGAHAHGFEDVERFAKIFDDPERDVWQRPEEVLALMDLEAGMAVVDLGAGTGYFESYLSRAVGPEGQVLALDVEPGMVEHMRTRFRESGLTNVIARRVEPDSPGLDANSADRILVVDTWHHISTRKRYAAALREALRPGGELWIVDFTPDSPHGPPPAMRLSEAQVRTELEAGGFEVDVIQESLPWQYAIRGRAQR